GIVLGGTGQLTGQGTVTANLTYTGSGTGTVQASGGALVLQGTLAQTLTYSIADVSGSILKIDVSGQTINAVTVDTSNKTLELAASRTLTISGAQTVTGGT